MSSNRDKSRMKELIGKRLADDKGTVREGITTVTLDNVFGKPRMIIICRWRNGYLHSEGNYPAVEFQDGHKEYFENGRLIKVELSKEAIEEQWEEESINEESIINDNVDNLNKHEKDLQMSEQIKILLHEGYGLAGTFFEEFYSIINGKMIVSPRCPGVNVNAIGVKEAILVEKRLIIIEIFKGLRKRVESGVLKDVCNMVVEEQMSMVEAIGYKLKGTAGEKELFKIIDFYVEERGDYLGPEKKKSKYNNKDNR